jgi:hypothetical protein
MSKPAMVILLDEDDVAQAHRDVLDARLTTEATTFET